MEHYSGCGSDTRTVVDDTTIYEVDMECYRCLTDREKELYFDSIEWSGPQRSSPRRTQNSL